MHEHASARQALEQMIRSGDLEGLLRQAEALHGHRCPFLALGVKAGQYAMNYLYHHHHHHEHEHEHGHGHGHAHGHSHGFEEVVAVVEGCNCLVDAIQVVTGCTLGNNGLIVKDQGKAAVTVARRRDGRAVRLAVRADFRETMFARYPVAGPLFEKVMVQKQATEEERHRFQHLWEAMARRELEVPLEEQFVVQTLTMPVPDMSKSLETVVCSRCGEGVLAARARFQEGQPLCLPCAGASYLRVSGRGVESVSP
ncbi:MAG: FmdE family protein [Thermodesulfobacteriota bacterium]